jgi:hypothetical protein
MLTQINLSPSLGFGDRFGSTLAELGDEIRNSPITHSDAYYRNLQTHYLNIRIIRNNGMIITEVS